MVHFPKNAATPTHREPHDRQPPASPPFGSLRLLGLGLALVLAGSILPLTQAGASASAAASASGSPGSALAVSPGKAVPGWKLSFQGNSPTIGEQQVVLQRFLNGAWHDRRAVTTDATGAFQIHNKQLAMPTEYYRVRGPGFVTGQVTVDAIKPDVDISASTSYPFSGQQFTLYAAVTPWEQGRDVKFFKANSSGGWDRLGIAPTDSDSVAHFVATGPGRYMAIAVRSHGASAYPSLVLTLPARSLLSQYVSDPESQVVLSPQPSSAHFSAEHDYAWYPTGEGYGWDAGQGTRGWSIYQGGAGMVSTYVGMLSLISGSYNGPISSYGTTVATLANQGHQYGRWEMRTKNRVYGSSSYTPYTVQLRLVRTGSPYQVEPTGVITIAEWTGFSDKTVHSVTVNGAKYAYPSYGTARNNINFHNYAVELTRKHLTWLIDGKVIATAPARMIPEGQWVPQFVLRDQGGRRMTCTRLASDWLRYFPLSDKNALRLPQGPTPTLTN